MRPSKNLKEKEKKAAQTYATRAGNFAQLTAYFWYIL
jgi:hypothetical protein